MVHRIYLVTDPPTQTNSSLATILEFTDKKNLLVPVTVGEYPVRVAPDLVTSVAIVIRVFPTRRHPDRQLEHV